MNHLKSHLVDVKGFFNNLIKVRSRENMTDEGFSLLELILAMAVLIVLTTSVSLSASAVKENAKNAAVEKAVSAVFQKAMVNESDSLDETTAQSAADEWNNSRQRDDVTVKAESDGDGNIFVSASYKGIEDSDIYRSGSIYGSLCVNGMVTSGENVGKSCSPGQGVEAPVPGAPISDTITKLTYNCDATTTGYLAVTGIKPGTKITMSGSNGSLQGVKYSNKSYHDLFYTTVYSDAISDKVTMKKSVEYKIIINGTFDKLSTPRETTETADDTLAQCLVSVDKIGENSEVTALSAFGGKKLTSVPDSIPSSVTSLKIAFRGATIFNDPNVSKWDVSNVTSLNYTFGTAKAFNQPLNDWNVSNVTDMYATFFSNSFDQPLDKWNTGKVTTLNQTFASNRAFSHSLNNWDVSNVTNMLSTFRYANSFNKPLDKWNTSKVTSMNTTFSYNSGFDQDISKWDVGKVTSYNDFAYESVLSASHIPSKFK